MTDMPRITPAENGPLIIENPPNLRGAIELDLTVLTAVAGRRGR